MTFTKAFLLQKLLSVKNKEQKDGQAWTNTHKESTENFQPPVHGLRYPYHMLPHSKLKHSVITAAFFPSDEGERACHVCSMVSSG